jgi:N-acetylhexosamine 1-kinase
MSESVLLLALELSLRFLGDYLLGDIYFGAKEPKENLWRAENQLTLAKDIEKKLPEMKRILSGKNVC